MLFNQFSLIQNYLINLRYNYDIQTHTKMCGLQANPPPQTSCYRNAIVLTSTTFLGSVLLPLCKQGPQPLKVSRKGSNLDLLFLPRILCNQLINLECYSTNNTVLVVANINNRNWIFYCAFIVSRFSNVRNVCLLWFCYVIINLLFGI